MKLRRLLVLCIIMMLGGRVVTAAELVAGSSAPSPSALPGVPLFKTFPVYSQESPQRARFVPSGYMGDSDVTLSAAYVQTPRGNGPCLRAAYKASGPKGWAGIYWQNPANNWGDVPGRAGFDLRGATRLTFWARGKNGGERIHEVRVGGIVGPYPDSDVATLSNIRLTPEWKQYTIDLSKKDLRHIIGGFGLFLNKAEDSGGVEFYLNDILFEGPQGETMAASSTSEPPLSGQLPTEPAAPAPVAVPVPAPVVPVPAAVPAAPEQKELSVKEVDEGLKVSFSSQLMFAPGQAALGPRSDHVLKQLVNLLNAYPTNQVLIEGHTDHSGDSSFNLKLSQLRAQAVRDSLIKAGGYEIARFRVVGYGDTRPIADNKTKSGRALNRRVEVTILKGATK